MVFGFFSKKSSKDKCLEKGKKLAASGRSAEAITYFEDALEADPSCEEAAAQIRVCREHLVKMNIEEAEALVNVDPVRAVEHARLALELAAGENDLAKTAGEALARLSKYAPKEDKKAAPEKPKRLFEPSCGCASMSCGDSCGQEEGEGFEEDPDDVFYFYLDSCDEEEKAAFEERGPAFRRAYVALQQGDGLEAGKWLSAAKKEEGSVVAVPYIQGMFAWMKGDAPAAEKFLAEASALAPSFTPAIKRRAMLLREMRRAPEAVNLLTPLAESRPDDKEALTMLSAALLEAGRPADAVERLGPYAKEEMKTNGSVALLWGIILEAADRAEESLTALKLAASLQSTNLEVLERLGLSQIRAGGREAENAVKVFKQCYRLDEEKGWYYLLRIAQAYAARGWMDEANSMLEEARKELPDTPEAQGAWQTVAANLASVK